jgi:hypothetical protein
MVHQQSHQPDRPLSRTDTRIGGGDEDLDYRDRSTAPEGGKSVISLTGNAIPARAGIAKFYRYRGASETPQSKPPQRMQVMSTSVTRELFFYTTSIVRQAKKVLVSCPGEAFYMRRSISYHLGNVGEYLMAKELAGTLTPQSFEELAAEASDLIPQLTKITHNWDGWDKTEAQGGWEAACLLIAKIIAALTHHYETRPNLYLKADR